MANPILGVFFHWLGGLASASFYIPYLGVKKWSWETYWLVGGRVQLDRRTDDVGVAACARRFRHSAGGMGGFAECGEVGLLLWGDVGIRGLDVWADDAGTWGLRWGWPWRWDTVRLSGR